MKKFTKLMLSVAAITAVSSAMAISAMAVDTITGNYDSATGVVTLEGAPDFTGDKTLLVLTEDTTVTAENAGTIIAQIDQDAEITTFQLATGIESGTYYIRMGGDGSVYTGTLTIGSTQPGDEPGGDVQTVTIMIGDIDENSRVTIADVTALARAQVGKKQSSYKNEWVSDKYTVSSVTSGAYSGTELMIGDIDQNERVTIADVTALARAQVGKKQSSYKNECVGAVVEAVEAAE